MRAAEAPHETLDPGDPELGAVHVEDAMVAVEHLDPALAQHAGDLVAAPAVVVVVAEDGHDRDVEVAAGAHQQGGVLGLPVRRQVAGQQDHVGAGGGVRESGRQRAGVRALPAVHVAGGRDAHPGDVGGSRRAFFGRDRHGRAPTTRDSGTARRGRRTP
jgi:hypothetical protein